MSRTKPNLLSPMLGIHYHSWYNVYRACRHSIDGTFPPSSESEFLNSLHSDSSYEISVISCIIHSLNMRCDVLAEQRRIQSETSLPQ